MTITQLKELLEKHNQVFLTGAGGTGKTYTLTHLLPRFSSPVKLATTNSAAVRIGGDTVHSAFKLGLANSLPELEAEDVRYYEWFCKNVVNDLDKARNSRIRTVRDALRYADLLVIDEISMMSASTFSLLFYRSQQCGMTLPPILMLGDLYQIPPVESKDAVVPQKMVYHSKHFNPVIVELTEIKRTHNLDFAKAQKSIRKGKYTEFVHNTLQQITKNTFSKDFNPTILVSTNDHANKINQARLDELQTPEHIIQADIKTTLKNQRQIDSVIRYMPPDKELTLKVGARVMFIQNDKEQGYYNGLQGVVKDIEYDPFDSSPRVTVSTDDGNEYKVTKTLFDKKRLKESSMGGAVYEVELEMMQVPLKVCYAMTIHKSQGASIESLEINCHRMFVAGQFYVAISRATDPTKVKLLNFDPSYVRLRNDDLDKYLDYKKDSIIYTPIVSDDSLKVDI